MLSSYLSIATILASFTISAIVIFFAVRKVATVKNELSNIKLLIVQIAGGTFNGDMPKPHIKESADIISALKRIATEVQEQQRTFNELAFTDELTHLPNSRRFNEELVRCFNFAKRGLSIGIVSLNVAKLKEVNNNQGRIIGDRMLQILANTLQECIRKTDLAARLGGDNFALILVDMEPDHMDEWTEKLENDFFQNFYADEFLEDHEPCDLHFGASFIDAEHDDNPHHVFERADRALYQTSKNLELDSTEV